MRRRFLHLATELVRAWTRVYTTGMPPEVRRRRCAEIESDIWESLHDPERTTQLGIQIVTRFTRGIPDDVLWRLQHTLAGGQTMWRKLAFLCMAAVVAMAVLWSFSPRSENQSLPRLPARPTPNYVERRRVPPPPPPPGPTWEEFVAKVNGRAPGTPTNRPNEQR